LRTARSLRTTFLSHPSRWTHLRRSGLFALLLLCGITGCETRPDYGVEERLQLPPAAPRQVWAVAPAVNLSGQSGVDPLLQADLLYAQLQSVRGVTAVPVNRVAEAYLALGIDGINSPGDAAAVCELLGVDALVVPTVTLYHPYDPPRMAAAVQVFAGRGNVLGPISLPNADAVRSLTRSGSADSANVVLPSPNVAGSQMIQRVGVFDARDGSVRRAAQNYAAGRFDPEGAAADRGVFLVADRYGGFVYYALLAGLMDELDRYTPPAARTASAQVAPAAGRP
jgi:hypothetical protein